MTFDDFSANDSQRWRYVSDKVMGGVSVGNLYFIQDEQESFAQLTGQVSTENNGGFIQFRTDVKKIIMILKAYISGSKVIMKPISFIYELGER